MKKNPTHITTPHYKCRSSSKIAHSETGLTVYQLKGFANKSCLSAVAMWEGDTTFLQIFSCLGKLLKTGSTTNYFLMVNWEYWAISDVKKPNFYCHYHGSSRESLVRSLFLTRLSPTLQTDASHTHLLPHPHKTNNVLVPLPNLVLRFPPSPDIPQKSAWCFQRSPWRPDFQGGVTHLTFSGCLWGRSNSSASKPSRSQEMRAYGK